MTLDFYKGLQTETDLGLYLMFARAENYTPEALAAANAELESRHLSPEAAARLEAIAVSQVVPKKEKPVSLVVVAILLAHIAWLIMGLLAK